MNRRIGFPISRGPALVYLGGSGVLTDPDSCVRALVAKDDFREKEPCPSPMVEGLHDP